MSLIVKGLFLCLSEPASLSSISILLARNSFVCSGVIFKSIISFGVIFGRFSPTSNKGYYTKIECAKSITEFGLPMTNRITNLPLVHNTAAGQDLAP